MPLKLHFIIMTWLWGPVLWFSTETSLSFWKKGPCGLINCWSNIFHRNQFKSKMNNARKFQASLGQPAGGIMCVFVECQRLKEAKRVSKQLSFIDSQLLNINDDKRCAIFQHKCNLIVTAFRYLISSNRLFCCRWTITYLCFFPFFSCFFPFFSGFFYSLAAFFQKLNGEKVPSQKIDTAQQKPPRSRTKTREDLLDWLSFLFCCCLPLIQSFPICCFVLISSRFVCSTK